MLDTPIGQSLDHPGVSELSRRTGGWMVLAARQAARSECKWRHGAVLVRGGSVLATGYNRMVSDPFATLGRCSVHAEAMALRGAKSCRGTLYVVRLRPDGSWAGSAPCRSCTRQLKESGVERVVFSTDIGVQSCKADTFVAAKRWSDVLPALNSYCRSPYRMAI